MIFRKQQNLYLTILSIAIISILFYFANLESVRADNCRDVGCRNFLKKIGQCRRGLVAQEFCGNRGPSSCCCSPKKVLPSTCSVIGCSKGCEVCRRGDARLTFYTADTEPIVFPFGGSRSLGFSCCCSNGDANIAALTCQDIQAGCQPSSSVEPRCSSDQRFASFDIYVKDESISENSTVVSSSSGCPVPFPPGTPCDIGTKQRTVTCCCR